MFQPDSDYSIAHLQPDVFVLRLGRLANCDDVGECRVQLSPKEFLDAKASARSISDQNAATEEADKHADYDDAMAPS